MLNISQAFDTGLSSSNKQGASNAAMTANAGEVFSGINPSHRSHRLNRTSGTQYLHLYALFDKNSDYALRPVRRRYSFMVDRDGLRFPYGCIPNGLAGEVIDRNEADPELGLQLEQEKQ